MSETLPLSGVRALSVGHTLPGLYCIAVLRDLGADVTRVEPLSGSRAAARFGSVGGTFPIRSLVDGTGRCEIDLKADRGPAVFRRLAARADVVLEGFRPGTAARLGIGYDALAAANPRLIYAAISGYGQDGPWRDRVGHDVSYLGATGALAGGADLETPPALPGLTAADGLAGMSAAVNVVAALHARPPDGGGRFLDVAIVDGPAFLMSIEYEHWWATGRARAPGGTHLNGAYPWYQVFETADGRHLSIAAVEPAFHATLCRRVGHPELADRQYVSGEERRTQMELFRDTFRRRTLAEWLALLGDDAGVTPVLAPEEAADAPHLARVRRSAPGTATPLTRSPVRFPEAPLAPARTTAETLTACGFTDAETEALRAAGTIGT